MNLKVCPNCQTPNESDKPFCTECGASLAVPEYWDVCPNCGAPNAAHKRFCADCGTPLTRGASADPSSTPATPVAQPAPTNVDYVIERKVLKEYRGNDVDLVVPEGVTTIGEGAFAGFVALRSIVLPEKLLYIEKEAFKKCEALTEIVLPDSVTAIGESAFAECKGLRKLVVGKGLASVGSGAFNQCDALAEIRFNGSLSAWCQDRIRGLGNLMQAGKVKTLRMEDGIALEDVVVPDDVTRLGCGLGGTNIRSVRAETVAVVVDYAFERCESLRQAVLPRASSIGNAIFSSCGSLESLTISFAPRAPGYRDHHIGLLFGYHPNNSAFSEIVYDESAKVVAKWFVPYKLREITIGEVHYCSFRMCNSIESVCVRSGNVPERSFEGCSSLKSVTISQQCEKIGWSAFAGCESLTEIALPNGLKSIEGFAFQSCTSLKSIALPAGLESIGRCAFASCTLLQSIALPEGLKSIEESAFGSCTALQSITLPEGLESIGRLAFQSCTSLQSITLPEGLESIGGNAFQSCTSLQSIIVPASVTEFGDRVFENCTSLQYAAFLSAFPDREERNGSDLFCGCKSLSTILLDIDDHRPEETVSFALQVFFAFFWREVSWTNESSANSYGKYSLGPNNYKLWQRASLCYYHSNLTSITGGYFVLPKTFRHLVIWGGKVSRDDGLSSAPFDVLISPYVKITIPYIFSKRNVYYLGSKEDARRKGLPEDIRIGHFDFATGEFSDDASLQVTTEKNLAVKSFVLAGSNASEEWDGRVDLTIDVEWFSQDGAEAYAYVWYYYASKPDWPGTKLSRDDKGLYLTVDPKKRLAGLILSRVIGGTVHNMTEDITALPSDHRLVLVEKGKEGPLPQESSAESNASESSTNAIPADNASAVPEKSIPKVVAAPKEGTDERGIKYRLREDDTYEVIELGAAAEVVIPSEYYGKAVTRFDLSALKSETLNSLTMPATLREITINWTIFSRRKSVCTLLIAENERFYSINNCIVDRESKRLVLGCDKSVIPTDGSVTEIGRYAFAGCSFAEFSLPDSIEIIGNAAFVRCENLTKIDLPAKLRKIGGGAFRKCKLTAISFPDSLQEIGSGAFDSNQLTEVVFPSGIKNLTDCCRDNPLVQVTIPSSVVKFERSPFEGCFALRKIVYLGSKQRWKLISKIPYYGIYGEKRKWDADCGEFVVQCTDAVIKK